MPKYEYSDMVVRSQNRHAPTDDDIIKELNRLGADGWQLAGSLKFHEFGTKTNTYMAIMAREIPE